MKLNYQNQISPNSFSFLSKKLQDLIEFQICHQLRYYHLLWLLLHNIQFISLRKYLFFDEWATILHKFLI